MFLNHKWKIAAAVLIVTVFAGTCIHGVASAQTDAKASPTARLPRVVDVGADKCIPCIMMAPELEKLRKEYAGALEVQFVDVWKYPEEANKYRVRGIPTQIFYDSTGKERARHLGYISKEDILAKFKELDVTIVKISEKGK
ncbi:MAG TPA: thioredoxin family protein [Syntrophorhabdaceae bacterium]|nr:thioredoxin family protein [Syntrophorhabdaceae bacterium]